jgi:hypothetical protein
MNEQLKQRIEENRAKHLRPAEEGRPQWLSLSSMVGKKITDLEGYVSFHFGMDTPVFNVCNVVFDDGARQSLQGEHDISYIPVQYRDDDTPGLTAADMYLCIDPGDIEEEDDEEFQEYLEDAERDDE